MPYGRSFYSNEPVTDKIDTIDTIDTFKTISSSIHAFQARYKIQNTQCRLYIYHVSLPFFILVTAPPGKYKYPNYRSKTVP